MHAVRAALSYSVEVNWIDARTIPEAMARLRRAAPGTLLGEPVTEVTDLLPLTDGVRLRTGRVRVVVRPSGTEPKLKCYLQVSSPVAESADLVGLREAAAADLDALRAEMAGVVGLSG